MIDSFPTLTTMGLDYHIHLFNLKVYRDRVLPAYQAFFDGDDTEDLITLTKECIPILEANPQLSDELLLDREICEEAIGILNGTVYYKSKGDYDSKKGKRETTRADKQIFVQGQACPHILELICVPRYEGVDSVQNITRTPLTSCLYERSEWIMDLFTGIREVRGGTLEIMIGEWSELFTKEDLQEFSDELSKVPAPNDPTKRKEYENLRSLLKLALADKDLTLVLSLY